jgi:hypothetical protein
MYYGTCGCGFSVYAKFEIFLNMNNYALLFYACNKTKLIITKQAQQSSKQNKAVKLYPLYAMDAQGGRGGIAPTRT